MSINLCEFYGEYCSEKLQIDKSWDQFEKDFSHKLTLIKFGNGNRVYGQKNKIIKVQNIDSISDRNNLGLQQSV